MLILNHIDVYLVEERFRGLFSCRSGRKDMLKPDNRMLMRCYLSEADGRWKRNRRACLLCWVYIDGVWVRYNVYLV